MSLRNRFVTPAHYRSSVVGVTLEPCPFCASHNLAVCMTRESHVSCLSCGADGPIGEAGNPQSTASKWNSRSPK